MPCLLPLVLSSGAWAAAPSQPGHWQTRQMRFDYLGAASGVAYSCEGLREMATLLLKSLGGVRSLQIEPGNCIPNFSTPSRFPYLTLKFEAFEPLAAGAADADATGSADGEWKHILWAPHHPFPLGTGDCELVDEFRLKVLPSFAVRDLQPQLHCEPFQGMQWTMAFEVFAPAAVRG